MINNYILNKSISNDKCALRERVIGWYIFFGANCYSELKRIKKNIQNLPTFFFPEIIQLVFLPAITISSPGFSYAQYFSQSSCCMTCTRKRDADVRDAVARFLKFQLKFPFAHSSSSSHWTSLSLLPSGGI